MYCFAPPQVPKTLLYKEEKKLWESFRESLLCKLQLRPAGDEARFEGPTTPRRPTGSPTPAMPTSTSTPTPTAVQESGLRTPNGSQGVQPPSTVHRPPLIASRIHRHWPGISCSLARKFTIAIKHLSLSLSASLLGRRPGLLVCSGQAQAYSQVLPTYSIVHRVIVT